MNDIHTALNGVINELNEKERVLQEREDQARAAIEDLHDAIVDYYKTNKTVAVTLLGVDEFASVLKEKVLKLDASGHEHMKKEVVDGLADISTMVSNLTQKLDLFMRQIKKTDE